MSEQTILTVMVALIPTVLTFINEWRKIKTTSQVSVYDKQKDWIEKLEKELEERDKKIDELEETLRRLEARIKELEEQNEHIELRG